MAIKKLFIFAFLAVVHADYLSTPSPISYSTTASYHNPGLSYTASPTVHTPAAVTSQSANIIRSPGNLGQVSTFTKTVDTPYSSVSKSDVRVSNPGYTTYTVAPPKAYATPVGYHPAPAPVHEQVVAAAPVHNAYPTIYRSSPTVGPALPNAYHQPAVLAPGHAPNTYQSPLFTQNLSPANYYSQPSSMPVYQHSVAAPAYQHHSVPVYQHSAAPVYQHSATPVYQHNSAAQYYQQPLAAPAYQHHAAAVYHAPAASYPYNHALAAPSGQSLLGVGYSHAPAVSRMTFDGHGINYSY